MWQISCRASLTASEAVGLAMEGFAVSVSIFETGVAGLVQLDGIALSEPDATLVAPPLRAAADTAGGRIEEVVVSLLPEVDWVAENRSSFPLMQIGQFIIHGSHLAPPPLGRGLGIHMDAALAFGSGSHATTEGCLRLLQGWARSRRPARVLDVGCGSGILGIAAARLWPTSSVVATDIDPVAVRTAADNFRINRVSARAKAFTAPGCAHPTVASQGPYDLVLANILAEPLVRLAPALGSAVAVGGSIILSGLLTRDERWVQAAYLGRGFKLDRCCRIGEWSALLLTRR